MLSPRQIPNPNHETASGWRVEVPTGPEHTTNYRRKFGHFVKTNVVDKLFGEEDLLTPSGQTDRKDPTLDPDTAELYLQIDPYAAADSTRRRLRVLPDLVDNI